MSKPRFAYIDTLRGLGASYVMLYHLALVPQPPLTVPSAVSWLVLNGGTGVTLFFVVSAFTLCHSMQERAADPHTVRHYFIRRTCRIVPLFYVWVVLSILRDYWFFGVSHPWWRILLTLGFGYNLVPGEQASFVMAGWTLGVEMIFYLVFPLVFRVVTGVWRGWLFVAVTSAASIAFNRLSAHWVGDDPARAGFVYFSVVRMLPLFAFGVLAYHLHRTYISGRPLTSAATAVSLALVVASAALYRSLVAGLFGPSIDGLIVQAPIYCLLLLGLSIVPWSFVVNRVTVYLGRISYSVYLNHPSLLVLLIPVFRAIYAQPLPLALRFTVCAVLATVVVVAVSEVTYRLVEQPGMRLGSLLVRQARARRAPLPSLG